MTKHLALDTIKRLIIAGCRLNDRPHNLISRSGYELPRESKTPLILMLKSSFPDIELVQFLLHYLSEDDLKLDVNSEALMLAINKNFPIDVIERLVKAKSNLNEEGGISRTFSSIGYSIERKSHYIEISPLVDAFRVGRIDIVGLLLDNMTDEDLTLPVHNLALGLAIRSKNCPDIIIERLINAKSGLNRDANLVYALKNQKFDIARLLIDNMNDGDLRHHVNKEALHLAITNQDCPVYIVEKLVKAEPNLNIKRFSNYHDKEKSILDLLIEYDHIELVRWLLANMSDDDLALPIHQKALCLIIKKEFFPLNIATKLINAKSGLNPPHESPLTIAIEQDKMDLVKSLLENMSDDDLQNYVHQKALILAIKKDYPLNVIERLIKAKSGIYIYDYVERPPLLFTIENNREDIFQMLIDNLNSVDLNHSANSYAIILSLKHNNFSFAQKLIDAGFKLNFDELKDIEIRSLMNDIMDFMDEGSLDKINFIIKSTNDKLKVLIYRNLLHRITSLDDEKYNDELRKIIEEVEGVLFSSRYGDGQGSALGECLETAKSNPGNKANKYALKLISNITTSEDLRHSIHDEDLECAIFAGDLEIIKSIIKSRELNSNLLSQERSFPMKGSRVRYLPLMAAIEYKNSDIVNLLLNYINDEDLKKAPHALSRCIMGRNYGDPVNSKAILRLINIDLQIETMMKGLLLRRSFYDRSDNYSSGSFLNKEEALKAMPFIFTLEFAGKELEEQMVIVIKKIDLIKDEETKYLIKRSLEIVRDFKKHGFTLSEILDLNLTLEDITEIEEVYKKKELDMVHNLIPFYTGNKKLIEDFATASPFDRENSNFLRNLPYRVLKNKAHCGNEIAIEKIREHKENIAYEDSFGRLFTTEARIIKDGLQKSDGLPRGSGLNAVRFLSKDKRTEEPKTTPTSPTKISEYSDNSRSKPPATNIKPRLKAQEAKPPRKSRPPFVGPQGIYRYSPPKSILERDYSKPKKLTTPRSGTRLKIKTPSKHDPILQ